MDLEKSYFLNPQCDNIKTLMRFVSIGLLILAVFSFMFLTSSRSILVFVQLLQILAISYLVYLNLSWPTCPENREEQQRQNNSSFGSRLAANLVGTFGINNNNNRVADATPRVDAIVTQPTIVG